MQLAKRCAVARRCRELGQRGTIDLSPLLLAASFAVLYVPVLVRLAASREFWNDRNCAAVGWSNFCQVTELIQRVSNFDSDRSRLTAWMAGSTAKTLIESDPPMVRPF